MMKIINNIYILDLMIIKVIIDGILDYLLILKLLNLQAIINYLNLIKFLLLINCPTNLYNKTLKIIILNKKVL